MIQFLHKSSTSADMVKNFMASRGINALKSKCVRNRMLVEG